MVVGEFGWIINIVLIEGFFVWLIVFLVVVIFILKFDFFFFIFIIGIFKVWVRIEYIEKVGVVVKIEFLLFI